jgi:hypothetical protein
MLNKNWTRNVCHAAQFSHLHSSCMIGEGSLSKSGSKYSSENESVNSKFFVKINMSMYIERWLVWPSAWVSSLMT